MRGVVVAFGEASGLGRIDGDGTVYPFHCTALLDGTRAVEVGAIVAFEVRPAGMGRWEAARVEKV